MSQKPGPIPGLALEAHGKLRTTNAAQIFYCVSSTPPRRPRPMATVPVLGRAMTGMMIRTMMMEGNPL